MPFNQATSRFINLSNPAKLLIPWLAIWASTVSLACLSFFMGIHCQGVPTLIIG